MHKEKNYGRLIIMVWGIEFRRNIGDIHHPSWHWVNPITPAELVNSQSLSVLHAEISIEAE
jgi:hypothetical protein